MDRVDYLLLRSLIESEIICNAGHGSEQSQDLVINNCMQHFLGCVGRSVALRQRRKREFITFRRSPDVKPPSWAYRKPGIDSRLPTL